ncbi:SCO family protein [Pelagerythrobacter rhizovicinus]|uniref:SCO family protein n=1 Tax=Pelagerythrobacter rhizovicinus TaxID=2268576 RepID=A0A4Q2KGJ8_9SPHN|nr:SCO family protein [Pelagerythrobacter rhizovicinus]RXZ64185.1 SCO family protein [Pelagerythrobacter rhizovicinus]
MTDPAPSGRTAKRLKALRAILWALVLLAAGAGLYALLNRSEQPPEAAPYGDAVGGPFALTAPDGSTVTERTLAGKPFALFFGFTRCPDVCPTTLARLAQLRERMGEQGDGFEIVFVSVDPESDTPEDIGRYVALFDTPILGLTGTKEQIDAIVGAYHAFYEKVPTEGGGYTVDHTASVFLMDREGKLQSIIDHHESAETSLDKLERLVSA